MMPVMIKADESIVCRLFRMGGYHSLGFLFLVGFCYCCFGGSIFIFKKSYDQNAMGAVDLAL